MAVRGNHLTTTENHMPFEITQCYLPPGSGDFPTFTPNLATPEERKAEFTWVVVISQDSLPAKDGHLSQK